MKSNRFFVVLALAASVLGLTVACGGGGGSSPTVPPPTGQSLIQFVVIPPSDLCGKTVPVGSEIWVTAHVENFSGMTAKVILDQNAGAGNNYNADVANGRIEDVRVGFIFTAPWKMTFVKLRLENTAGFQLLSDQATCVVTVQ